MRVPPRARALIAALALVLGAWIVHSGQVRAPDAPARQALPVTTASVAADLAVDPTTTGTVVDLVAEPAGTLRLEGQVVTDDDVAAGGAEVVIDSRPPRRVIAAEDGSFAFEHLPPRQYSLIARDRRKAAGPTMVELAADIDPVVLRLRNASSLEVTVVDEETRGPIASASVEVRGIDAPVRLTDAAGVARFDGILGGTHVLAIDAPDRAPVRIERFLHGQGDALERTTIAVRRGVSVRGTVSDDAGVPVHGARVIAMPAGALQMRADAARDGVPTDATGGWILPALAAGTYRLVAVHAAYPVEIGAPLSVAARPLDGVALRFQAGGRLRGIVRTARGEPAPGARVTAGSRGGAATPETSRDAVSDASGRFELGGLRTGAIDVIARHRDTSAPTVHVDLDATRIAEVELVLSQTETIGGSVIASDTKQPVAEATVVARAAELAAGEALRGVIIATADHDGGFALGGLRAGTPYLLYAARPGEAAGNAVYSGRPLATVLPGRRDVRLELDATHALRGRIAIAGGRSPGAFTVAIGNGARIPFGAGDGSFTVRGVAPGECRLVFDGPALQRRAIVVQVPAGRDHDLGTIELEAGHRLVGHVTTSTGVAVAGARVAAGQRLLGDATSAVAADMLDALGARQTTTGPDGGFALDGLGERVVVVVAEHPEHGRSPEVRARAGAIEPLVLALQPTGRLDGRVVEAGRGKAGVPLVIASTAPGRAPTRAVTDTRGEFSVLSLPPGEYRVIATLSDGGDAHASVQTRAQVQVGTTVRVELATAAGVTVRIDPRIDGAPVVEGQLLLAAQPGGGGSEAMAIIGAQRPVRLAHIQPGAYRACIVPALDARRVLDTEDLRHARCGPLTIPAEPAEQDVVLDPPASR